MTKNRKPPPDHVKSRSRPPLKPRAEEDEDYGNLTYGRGSEDDHDGGQNDYKEDDFENDDRNDTGDDDLGDPGGPDREEDDADEGDDDEETGDNDDDDDDVDTSDAGADDDDDADDREDLDEDDDADVDTSDAGTDDGDDDNDDMDDDAVKKDTADSVPQRPPTGACVEWLHYYLANVKARQERVRVHGVIGAATGFKRVDEATNGLQQLTIIAGQTQTGKTSFAVQCCIDALRNDALLGVVYYLLDDFSWENFFDLMICSQAQVDLRTYLNVSRSEAEAHRIQDAINTLQRDVLPRLRIVKQPRSGWENGLDSSVIISSCHQFQENAGLAQMMVVLDMIEDMPLPCASDYEEDIVEAHRAQADPSRWRRKVIASFRKCRGVQMLVLTKLRKSQGGKPTIEDLLGDVELGYLAQQIFLLARDPAKDKGPSDLGMRLIVAKARGLAQQPKFH